VRFVSKRGTVPVFPASERDRAHTATLKSDNCHALRHESASRQSMKPIVQRQNNAQQGDRRSNG